MAIITFHLSICFPFRRHPISPCSFLLKGDKYKGQWAQTMMMRAASLQQQATSTKLPESNVGEMLITSFVYKHDVLFFF